MAMPPKNFSAHFALLTDPRKNNHNKHLRKDLERDFFMEQQGVRTLRFNNLQVLQSINDVMDVIFNALDSY